LDLKFSSGIRFAFLKGRRSSSANLALSSGVFPREGLRVRWVFFISVGRTSLSSVWLNGGYRSVPWGKKTTRAADRLGCSRSTHHVARGRCGSQNADVDLQAGRAQFRVGQAISLSDRVVVHAFAAATAGQGAGFIWRVKEQIMPAFPFQVKSC